MKSILTGKAENVYGIMSRENPLGRGIRFGIAEQNMAMMSLRHGAGHPARRIPPDDAPSPPTACSPA